MAVQVELAALEVPAWVMPPRMRVGACAIVFDDEDRAWAAAAVMQGRRVIALSMQSGHAGAPYAPGLLALREGPLLQQAVEALTERPDVLLVDATGRDHPRQAGLALHLGAQTNLPTVGVTNRPLLAEGTPPEPHRGATSPLLLNAQIVGAWLRTRDNANPVAVHAAWRTDADAAIAVALQTTRGHRTPEPLRHARRAARLARAAA